jgi:WD40 repeat protein
LLVAIAGSLLFSHLSSDDQDGAVTSVTFSPDGKLIASSGTFSPIFLWGITTQ